MAIHYVSDIRHITCATKSGRRRSPMTDASYNADQPLLDEETGRTIYRPHRDGTVVWGTDIVSADPSCPYGDSTIPSQIRRERLNNDTYRLMKNKTQQHHAGFNVALPNGLTQKEALRCAHNMAMSFSKEFHRPVGYSVHHKAGNLHIHFEIPEWSWENGQWGAKSVSYYKGKDGSRIYGKNFYDKDGNDLRIPKMETVTLPDGTTTTRQKRGNKNDLLWERVHETPFYKKSGWIHDEVDRQINLELERIGSQERVTRHNKEIEEKLNHAGLKEKHIGPRSCKVQDARYHEMTQHNNRVRMYRDALTKNKSARDEAEQELQEISNSIQSMTNEKIDRIEMLMEQDTLLGIIQNNQDTAISRYIEDELQPEERFVAEAENAYRNFLSTKRKIIGAGVQVLDTAIASTTTDIGEIKKDRNRTPRIEARLRLLEKNCSVMTTLRDTVQKYSRTVFLKRIKYFARKKWNGLTRAIKYNYVKSRFGETDALLYGDYLGVTESDKLTQTVPVPLTLPEGLNKLQKLADTTFADWTKSIADQNHIPPQNVKVLSELLAMEKDIAQAPETSLRSIPENYDALEGYKIYQSELANIQRSEAVPASRPGTDAQAEQSHKSKPAVEAASRPAKTERVDGNHTTQSIITGKDGSASRPDPDEAKATTHKQKIVHEQNPVTQPQDVTRQASVKATASRPVAETGISTSMSGKAEAASRPAKAVPEVPQSPAASRPAGDIASGSHGIAGTASRPVPAVPISKKDYYQLSDKAALAKIRIMITLSRMALADKSRDFSSVLDGVEYYETHSKIFEADVTRFGLDYSEVKNMQTEMQRIWSIVKDEEYQRPTIITQRPERVFSLDEMKKAEQHLTTLQQTAQKEKAKLIEDVVSASIINYQMYENRNRSRYNSEHYMEKDFQRKKHISYEEAETQLREMYENRSDLFIQAAQQCRIDISSYTAPVTEADTLRRQLDEYYVYRTQEDKKTRSSKKRSTRTTDRERNRIAMSRK